ncbi:MAG: DNA repair protein RadA [Bacteroidetes bacterium]|nr:DNA repair protein RadA [Bacteroidota bacterium]
MSKIKTSFFCQNCGAQSGKWIGKCPSCNEWNTYVEEVIQKSGDEKKKGIGSSNQRATKPLRISEIEQSGEIRIALPDKELNRVLGGGVVPGSVVLFGGEPGIGKSTLMLQIALQQKKIKTLYISGEESEQQIRMRADRMGGKNEDCYILSETSMQNIFKQIEMLEPNLVIVDSIQTMYSSHIDSSPGSISQVRECTAELLRYAKESSTPVFLIGHITKDGMLAGPKVLEHMVDTVLQFEGDRHHIYRLLRTLKNRFGSTNELGIYEMTGIGLREVSNPSEILITAREEPVSGVAIATTMEGIRPMLIEIQTLVSSAVYGTPQRTATGFDTKRLSMLLAVLEKRCGFKLGLKDVFLNVAGGIKVEDPAIDLAVICAVLSSSEDIPISQKFCFCAEVGLSGEIRPVSRIESRISEAEKLGFSTIFISKYNLKGLNQKSFGIKITSVGKVEDVFRLLFG